MHFAKILPPKFCAMQYFDQVKLSNCIPLIQRGWDVSAFAIVCWWSLSFSALKGQLAGELRYALAATRWPFHTSKL